MRNAEPRQRLDPSGAGLASVRTHVKVFHWQTHKYGHHKALNKLFVRLEELNDTCVEICMGHFGRPRFREGDVIRLENIAKPRRFCRRAAQQLALLRRAFPNQTDLQNVLDSIIGALWRSAYLLSLE